jgi:Spy/CpxP family protein refolding chaperone
MNKPFAFLTLALLAAPLALAQTPAPPSPDNAPAPPPAGVNGDGPMRFHPGPITRHFEDRGPLMRDHGDRDGMRFERGPEGLPGMRVPPGTWWRDTEVANRIGLSADQVKKIDTIFLDSRVQLIHMHATLEEEQLRLEPLLSANPVNQQAAEAQIAKIADTRADLEKANAKMLLTIRGVLTADQWTKLEDRRSLFRGPGPGAGVGVVGPHGTHRTMPVPPGQPAPPAE